MVVAAVIHQGDLTRRAPNIPTIESRADDAAVHAARVLHPNAVLRRFVLIGDLISGPGTGNARIEGEHPAAYMDAQYPLYCSAVHPPCGSGIPSPTTAADVLTGRVHIGADDIGFDLVTMNVCWS